MPPPLLPPSASRIGYIYTDVSTSHNQPRLRRRLPLHLTRYIGRQPQAFASMTPPLLLEYLSSPRRTSGRSQKCIAKITHESQCSESATTLPSKAGRSVPRTTSDFKRKKKNNCVCTNNSTPGRSSGQAGGDRGWGGRAAGARGAPRTYPHQRRLPKN